MTMAFEYLQSLDIVQDLDNDGEVDDESDIDIADFEFEIIGEVDGGVDGDGSAGNEIEMSDDETETEIDQEWGSNLSKVTDHLEPFTEFVGPVHDLPEDSEPLDYFQLFFPESMIELFVEETNKHADEKQAEKGEDDVYWKPVTSEDIYKYIYTLIVFGLHPLPDVRLYWSSDPFWRVPAVADVWSRQRFIKVHQYFRVTDKSKQPARGSEIFDPLFKIRPVLDHVSSTCSFVYMPSQNLSVDQAVVASTGLVSFRRYVKDKPTPWGFKVWCCTETDTGYVLNFQICTGTGSSEKRKRDTTTTGTSPSPSQNCRDDNNMGQGHVVVKTMLEERLGKNHSVYFHDVFSSIQLAEDLLQEKTYSCGAVIGPNAKGWPIPKTNKKNDDDDELEEEESGAGDVKMMQKGNLVAVQWTGKSQVHVLSTNCDPVMTTIQRRTTDDSSSPIIDVRIPAPVLAYNSAKFGSVDDLKNDEKNLNLNHHAHVHCPVGRADDKKWWRYLLNYLIQISISNSFILMKKACPKETDPASPCRNHLVFRRQLAKGLLAKASASLNSTATPSSLKRRQLAIPTVAGCAKPFSNEHTLIRMPGRKRRCFQCRKDGNITPSGRTKETTSGCPLCKVHLHRGQCYSRYHEELKHYRISQQARPRAGCSRAKKAKKTTLGDGDSS